MIYKEDSEVLKNNLLKDQKMKILNLIFSMHVSFS